MTRDKITYCDEPAFRVLDLRPDGIACIPVLGLSNFQAIRKGPDFHFHPDCVEFCLCLKGNLTFETPDRTYPFMPDTLFVSLPDQPHHLCNNPSGLKIYRILFRIPKPSSCILGLDARGSEWIVRSLTHLPKRLYASSPAVKQAFERLFKTYDTVKRKSPSRKVKMQAAALDLLIALIDAARRLPVKVPDNIREIANRISASPAEPHPVKDLARACHVSVASFIARFKQSFGLPPHTYVLNCRIERAKQLLRKTDRTVGSIAQELHFYSHQHFAKTFQRVVGLTPGAYKRGECGRRGTPLLGHRFATRYRSGDMPPLPPHR